MKNVYVFASGHADGNAQMTDVLGGKGANLAEMTNLGIPVPPGFTISAAVCRVFLEVERLTDEVRAEVNAAMDRIEAAAGKRFGDEDNPLLVSVRSGAKVSMPGMMDSILNLGLNDRTVEALARQSGNRQFAFDSYRRLIQMYGDVVTGIGKGGSDPFHDAHERLKRDRGAERDVDLTEGDLEELVATFKSVYREHTGHAFPDDPWDQLRGAVEAVFRSWNTDRAREYRRLHGIARGLGTAVNVLAMVYGNMGDGSCTGVVFTRDPATGERSLYGEYLLNAQGEDVVAGTRDPEPVAAMAEVLPDAYEELATTCELLERHYRDMQDVEFTVERGTLYILQTRTGKRTPQAAVRIAVEMARAGTIDRRRALLRVEPGHLDELLHPCIDPDAKAEVLVQGLPASPGAASGAVVLDSKRAAARAEAGDSVILVRSETSADDLAGLAAARGALTSRGGMTSHAAVVARGIGRCCIVGAKDVEVDEEARCFRVGEIVVQEGDVITLDGSRGLVFRGEMPLVEPHPGEEFEELMSWADEARELRVLANADTPEDAVRARRFGAQGIGLCRTEHMFFGDRIQPMREMILATDSEGRRRALSRLLPMQREDFAGMFRAMDGLPVTIRLLDPPLHEFLPREDNEMRSLADAMGVSVDDIRRTVEALRESNPMLGHRGCRLGITHPEVTEMQSRAVFEAACAVASDGVSVHPEVMVPLVADVEELRRQGGVVREVAERVFEETGRRVGYRVGTMIEVPRAALTAGEIARIAEFFSFGTNDLTQMTMGLSRDDAMRFLPLYLEEGVMPANPFTTLDQVGVGQLIELAVQRGRKERPDLALGICGEHGGDPASIEFCHRIGLDYVSCSPFRVVIARLAAAQAALPPPPA